MSKEITKDFEALGFTSYESKVLYVLFEGYMMTASEIAKKAGIPRTSTYDILRSFVSKGICNEIHTSSVSKFEMIDPHVVKDKIEKEIHETFTDKISKLKDSFDRLTPLFRAKEKEAEKVDVELIKGFNKNRFSRFMKLWRAAESELLLMNKLEGYVNTETDEFTKEFLKRGGVIKTIYEVSADFKIKLNDKWITVKPDDLSEFVSALEKDNKNSQTRFTYALKQNMAIFDRKEVYISLVDPTVSRYNRSDIIIKNKNYAESMAEYFELCWEKSFTPDKLNTKKQQ